jgi:hypothetical protein
VKGEQLSNRSQCNGERQLVEVCALIISSWEVFWNTWKSSNVMKIRSSARHEGVCGSGVINSTHCYSPHYMEVTCPSSRSSHFILEEDPS